MSCFKLLLKHLKNIALLLESAGAAAEGWESLQPLQQDTG